MPETDCKRRRWTKEEDAYLLTHLHLDYGLLADNVGRSRNAVVDRIRRLKGSVAQIPRKPKIPKAWTFKPSPCKPGCIYAGRVDEHSCCNYIFIQKRQRPCPPGKDCTEYKKGARRKECFPD